MALVSPGLQITVTDESQYVPGAVGTVPLVILATEQDKLANGLSTSNTSKATAGKLQRVGSQRELVAAYGYPTFQQSAAGTALNGDETNEYGLMAAYSALGLGNSAYTIRADIDLTQLTATSIRPKGKVSNGVYWLDLVNTAWGIYEWDEGNDTTPGFFTLVTPTVITSSDDTVGTTPPVPLDSIGLVGDYAVVLVPDAVYGTNNYVYYKNSSNAWVELGTTEWQNSYVAVTGTILAPVLAAGTNSVTINGTSVVLGSSANLSTIVTAINSASISGVIAAADTSNRLVFYIDATSESNGSIADGIMTIVNTGGSNDVLASVGIESGDHSSPALSFGSYVQIPSWRMTDDVPRPTGSVFVKTSVKGAGASLGIKIYNATTDTWTSVAAPLYSTEAAAIYGLDSAGGGSGLDIGTIYTQYDVFGDGTATTRPFRRSVLGAVKTTGTIPLATRVFTASHTIQIRVTQPGNPAPLTYSTGVGDIGTTTNSFVAALLSLNIPNLNITVESSGAISFTHRTGGTIWLSNLSGTALSTAGFTTSTTGVRVDYTTDELVLSGFKPLTYTYSTSEPYKAPDDGTLWHYGDALAADILINNGTTWTGYLTGGIDARGYNLSNTDPAGPILSATAPMDGDRSDGGSLVPGDLWIDTSDLENYPKLYRYNDAAVGQWIAIDNSDSVNQNGIVFADARWDTDGTTDPITGDFPSLTALLSSSYTDLDCPDAQLYARGTLLFNTRRSGFNVKQYVSNKFTSANYPNESLPDVTATWVTASGNKDDGSPYMGTHAQRRMVVKAMRAAISASTELREDRFAYSLIVAPGYPELIPDMVALNNDRRNTAFVIGDTPMTLPANGIQITNWSNGVSGVYGDGLTTADPYLGVFYPAAQTADVGGNTIVVPASHMMLRTFIRSDNVSYQWFAPAGTRRGLIDNASVIGYLSTGNTKTFIQTGVSQSLRDSMYLANVNPITQLTGVGLTAFGQKTRNGVASALDRINVARLVNYIRTILANVGNGFLFEPNDKITRDQIKSIIDSAMNDLVAKRGLYDYVVVCDSSNNTPDRISKNELYVDIAIEPMKDVEFIYIPIRLKNPGDIAKGV